MLMWGAELVAGIDKMSPVKKEHLQMPDLFLDGLIYAYNYTMGRPSSSPEAKQLITWLVGEEGLMKSDRVAVETLT